MIQRVQTLFLLATAILLIVVLFVPIWDVSVAGGTANAKLDAFNLEYSLATEQATSHSTVYIAAVAILAALNALYAIFQFKKRKFQMTLGWLNILLISGLIGAFFLGITKGQELVGTETGSFKIGFFLPIVALITTYLANHFIKKDEKLVRSMDRLR